MYKYAFKRRTQSTHIKDTCTSMHIKDTCTSMHIKEGHLQNTHIKGHKL